MKLPLAWIGAAFATGILLAGARPFDLTLHPAAPAAAAIGAIAVGAAFAWRNRSAAAWACALLAWCALGAFAVSLERAAVPENHVLKLIAARKLDTRV